MMLRFSCLLALLTPGLSFLKCPDAICECPLDLKGKRHVVCLSGGLEDPLPVLHMPEDAEILTIQPPHNHQNTLTLGPIFKGHQNLEEIHVTYSGIPALGAHSFWGLRKLQVLNVSHNALTALMPTNFRGPDQLHNLDLSFNNIESIPSAVFRHVNHLRILNLSNNKIPELAPQIFYGLSNLEELDLSYNPLGELLNDRFSDVRLIESVKCVQCGLLRLDSNLFATLPKLRFLDLRNNQLMDLPSFSLGLHLNQVYLDYNHITDLNKGALVGLSLKRLSLSHNIIKNINVNAFANASIANLDLSYNRLTTLDSKVFDPIIGQLRDFHLSGNGLSSMSLLSILPKGRQLRRLGLGEMGLTRLSSDLLKRSRQLRYLNVSSNYISKFPHKLLYSLPALATLDLSSNSLNGLDYALIQTFKSMKTLTKVKLEDNPWICEDCQVGLMIEWLKYATHQHNSISACVNSKSSKNCLVCANPPSLMNYELLLLNEEQLRICDAAETTQWPSVFNEHESLNEENSLYEDATLAIVKLEEKNESIATFFQDHLALLVGVGCGLALALLLVVVFAVIISRKQSTFYYTSAETSSDDERKEKLVGRNNNDSPVIRSASPEVNQLPSYTPMAISVVHARSPIRNSSTSPPVSPISHRLLAIDTIEEDTSLHSGETDLL